MIVAGGWAQSVEQALDVAEGKARVVNADSKEEFAYSLMYACVDHPDVTISGAGATHLQLQFAARRLPGVHGSGQSAGS